MRYKAIFWDADGVVLKSSRLFSEQLEIDYVQMICDAGVRCFMTTDQEKYRGDYLKNLLDNHKPFERVFYSGQIGAIKKDPMYYEHVYDALNQASRAPFSELIAKEDILVIDDG